jgi:hypothetical protein
MLTRVLISAFITSVFLFFILRPQVAMMPVEEFAIILAIQVLASLFAVFYGRAGSFIRMLVVAFASAAFIVLFLKPQINLGIEETFLVLFAIEVASFVAEKALSASHAHHIS